MNTNTGHNISDAHHDSQKYICDDMKNTWAIIWGWLEAIVRKAYLLLASTTAVVAIFISLQPRDEYPLILISPTCLILGAIPCVIPALLSIKGKWEGLSWSEHSGLPYSEILKESGAMMERNIEKLWSAYLNASDWLKLGRRCWTGGMVSGILSYILITISLG